MQLPALLLEDLEAPPVHQGLLFVFDVGGSGSEVVVGVEWCALQFYGIVAGVIAVLSAALQAQL